MKNDWWNEWCQTTFWRGKSIFIMYTYVKKLIFYAKSFNGKWTHLLWKWKQVYVKTNFFSVKNEIIWCKRTWFILKLDVKFFKIDVQFTSYKKKIFYVEKRYPCTYCFFELRKMKDFEGKAIWHFSSVDD